MALPESVGLSSDRLARLDQQMHQFVIEGKLSGVQTAIKRKGKLVRLSTFGYQDIDTHKKLAEKSLWRIYSMTKPIVATGLMMLYEEGKFQLNDPVERNIPELQDLKVHVGKGKTVSAKIESVLDLLRHTNGLGYGWGPGGYVDSIYTSIDRWALADNHAFVETLRKSSTILRTLRKMAVQCIYRCWRILNRGTIWTATGRIPDQKNS